MAAIVNSVEISRRPEDVFAYVTDPAHLHEWQESVVKVEGQAPYTVGSKVVVTRRVGRMEREMTSEIAALSPPRSWVIRGVDGPIRGNVQGSVEPLGDGERSQVTIALDLEGHGLGKLLLPLIVRRQVEKEMPKNMEALKRQVETAR
jgi:uncharacterized protein YndB with AHSA1/START domain